jgi:capsule biosynthesis phosphatase
VRFCFDLDGVICHTYQGDYSNSFANYNVISQINELYSRGHTIIIATARGMKTHRGNAGAVQADLAQLTLSQLQKWNVQYHEIHFSKPAADLYIDDKAHRFISSTNLKDKIQDIFDSKV